MEDKFNYFIDQTNQKLSSIEEKIDNLASFRFMLIGASITLSGLFAIVTTLITLALMRS